MSRYAIYFSCFVSLFLGLVSTIDFLIDPYGLYEVVRIDGINDRKPEVKKHIRMHKAAAVKRVEPQSVALGNSRVEYAIDPSHPQWRFEPVYNLGLVGANIYEIMRYFQHTQATRPLRQALLAVDFCSFNALQDNEADFEESRLAMTASGEPRIVLGPDLIQSLLSFDAIRASYDTATLPRAIEKTLYLYRGNGQREVDYNEHNIRVRGGHHRAFLKSEQYFAEEGYVAGSKGKFAFIDSSTGVSSFDWFRQILAFAYDNGIDLHIYISPSHARQWELLAAMGLWDEFEQWKKTLVAIIAEEAQRVNKAPVPLWDFSGYNRYTSEEVPPLGDTETKMKWYLESSHLSHRLGNLVLTKVFDQENRESDALRGFGVRLVPSNVEAHLERIRQDREIYRTRHPKDVEEVRAVVAEHAPQI